MAGRGVDRRSLLTAAGGLAGAAAVGGYGASRLLGHVDSAGSIGDGRPGEFDGPATGGRDAGREATTARVGPRREEGRTPPGFGPHDRPGGNGDGHGRPHREVRAGDPDVFVVCHRHPGTDAAQYDAVVETLVDAADYHSSWRKFAIAVVDRGEDLRGPPPEFGCDPIYEYARGREGRYATRHDVHLLVFDNPWYRVGMACGKVGWDRGQEAWSVAAVAAGWASRQSEPYMKGMALHEVGHTLIRGRAGEQWIDGHEAGGTVHDGDDRVSEIYPMSNTYVLDGEGNCDVAPIACKDAEQVPGTFVGCKDNGVGAGFADPFARALFWSNPRTHEGTRCRVTPPEADDGRPGFTEDEIALTTGANLRS